MGRGGSTLEKRRSVLGICSLALSVSFGVVLVVLVLAVGALARWVSPEMEAPRLGLLVGLTVLFCVISLLTSLALAAVALVRSTRGWRVPAAAWMVAASALLYAGFQGGVWTPFAGPEVHAPRAEPGMAEGLPEDEAIMPEPFGPPPSSPPEAILTSARRDAVGLEGTYCWAPRWASNCVEDAGIPLLDERDTIAVQRDGAADLVFVLRASEGEFEEGNPVIEGATAYPVGQETEILPGDAGAGYLVPAGGDRALEKSAVDFEKGNGLTRVFATVPAGEYIFQVSATPPKGVDAWKRATYHFRVLVLPEGLDVRG